MSHKLHRLSSKVYNTPHLITASAFESITDYLEKRNAEDFVYEKDLALADIEPRSVNTLMYNADTGVGIIPIEGVLSYVSHVGFCTGESASYQRILSDAKTLFKAGAKVLVIDADSGGGEAYGMMETASELRKLADNYGAKLITYVDGLAASAMYGIASVSHEIVMNPEAEAGSIGVVVSLANYSEADKRYGVKFTYITAGDSKVPWDADGEFKKEFLDDIQMKVDKLYDKFTNHVATYRNMSQETIKRYGAKVYLAEDALEKGLVDSIMTREEFFDYLGKLVEGNNKTMSLFDKGGKMSTEHVELAAQLTQLRTEFEAATQANEVLQTNLAAALEGKASLDAQLAAALSQLKAVEESRKAEKEASRLSQLTAVIGEAKAKEQIATMSSFDDNQFSSVLSLLSSNQKAVEQSTLMSEIGDEGDDQDPASDMSYEDIVMAKLEAHRNKNKQ